MTGKKFIDEFKENNVGNPDNIYEINGEIYNYNDLFIIQFFFKIQNFLVKEPKKILEIGGGYGGLAYKLKKYPKSTLYLVDLPEDKLLNLIIYPQFIKKKNFSLRVF